MDCGDINSDWELTNKEYSDYVKSDILINPVFPEILGLLPNETRLTYLWLYGFSREIDLKLTTELSLPVLEEAQKLKNNPPRVVEELKVYSKLARVVAYNTGFTKYILNTINHLG